MARIIAATALRITRPDRLRQLGLLEASQWRPAEKLQAESDAKLTRILRHTIRTVPFYREFALERGLEPTDLGADHLGIFPRVDKVFLSRDQERFLAADCPPGDRIPNHTGGSTGRMFHFFIDSRTNQIRHAIDLRGRTWAGWRLGAKQALLWGHRGDVSQRLTWSGRLRNSLVTRSITLNAYDMDRAAMERYVALIRSFGPVIMIGYASALAYIADHLAAEGAATPSLRGLISSAETLTEDHRVRIERTFRIPLLDRYGSREFGVVAQQCAPGSGLHISSERVRLEILSPAGEPCGPGEQGEIVLTDLDNYAMPFLRYRTGDLARWASEPCSCGRGLPLLAGVDGRTSDLIVGVNGRICAFQGPSYFSDEVDGIGQMQIEQERLESITVRIVPAPDWSGESARRLEAKLRRLLGEVQVTVQIVDDIPVTASGKYRFAISSVSPFRS